MKEKKIIKEKGRKIRKRKVARKPTKKSAKKKYFFGKISKFFLLATAGLVFLYMILGLAVNPQFLKKDIEEKYGRVLGAMNVSVLVRGLPVKPTITNTEGCSNSYPYVNLDWSDDLGVDTFDIWRDGNLLVSGLTASNYRDENVELATTYTYYVVATGPLGVQQSDEISVTTEAECYIPPPPPPPANFKITRLDIIDLTNFRCAAKTNKKKPTFAGTTNMPGARIAVEIVSGRKIRKVLSTFWANSNGYWSWRSQGKLKTGNKIAYFTAYDPGDANRFATASLSFRVGKKPSKKFLKKCRISALLPTSRNFAPSPRLSLPMSLRIEENQKIVHQGEKVSYSLSSPSGTQSLANIQTGILDEEGNIVFEKNGAAGDGIKIDENLLAGNYKIFARYVSGNSDVSAEDDFKVKEKPFIVLSPGYEITFRQILGNLGWAALFSLGLLGMFLFLLLFEYHLSRKAFFQVTESDLKKEGMID